MRLKNFEQRGFARAVAADDADDFALLDLKRNVLERPKLLLFCGPFLLLRPQPLEGVVGRPFEDVAQAIPAAWLMADDVALGQVFDRDDGGTHSGELGAGSLKQGVGIALMI